MPRTNKSNEQKSSVKAIVEGYLGEMSQPNSRRPDWLVSEDEIYSLFLTFTSDNIRFFDIKHNDLSDWKLYSRPFILFILDSYEKTFIVPICELEKHLRKENLTLVDNGAYKLHLVDQSNPKFKELPSLLLKPYLNNFNPLKENLINELSVTQSTKLEEPEQTYQEGVLIPEEILQPHSFYEGTCQQIHVNAFERDRDARSKCIDYYGVECAICGFDFQRFYGTVGANFIHVHHLTPLSKIRDRYQVDPIQDLRPICPNCHAIIHLRNPPYSIEEVKQFIRSV